MNKAVLALNPLREAIGSEWRHKHLSGTVHIIRIDEAGLIVHITETTAYQSEWPIQLFLKNFSPALPRDQVPSWYERLLADKLL